MAQRGHAEGAGRVALCSDLRQNSQITQIERILERYSLLSAAAVPTCVESYSDVCWKPQAGNEPPLVGVVHP